MILDGITDSAFFCVNTGEKPLERISMRHACLSLVLPQKRALNVFPAEIVLL